MSIGVDVLVWEYLYYCLNYIFLCKIKPLLWKPKISHKYLCKLLNWLCNDSFYCLHDIKTWCNLFCRAIRHMFYQSKHLKNLFCVCFYLFTHRNVGTIMPLILNYFLNLDIHSGFQDWDKLFKIVWIDSNKFVFYVHTRTHTHMDCLLLIMELGWIKSSNKRTGNSGQLVCENLELKVLFT